jgi:hypothetical protein
MIEHATYPSTGWSGTPLGVGGQNAVVVRKCILRARDHALAWADTPHGGLAMLLATTLLARLLFASWLGLGIDESYMVAESRHFHLGYFDHPPIAWWLVWATTHLFGTESDLVVRLPFVLLFTLSTWLMFRLTSDLFGACAALWAAALLNAAPVLGVTTGSWVLPDGPLVAALLAAAVCLVRAVSNEQSNWRCWLGAGTCFGLALCSKYIAAPIGLGALIYFLTQPQARRLLMRPQPYVAAVIALTLLAPVVVWNATHGWASLLFQGARANGGKWHPFGPLSTVAGEALFFLPWIWLPLAVCTWRAIRLGPADPRRWLLVCLSPPTFLLFELVSLKSHVLFHWTAPAVMLALPLLGDAVGQMRRRSQPIRIGLVATAAIVTLGALLVASEVRFNWLPEFGEDFAMGADPDLGAVDWNSLRIELAKRGELQPGAVVAAIRWVDAGKIDYALHGEVPVICLGNDPREYGLSSPAAAYVGRDLLIVAPRETLGSIDRRFGTAFQSLEERPPVILKHAGKPAMVLPLFIGHQFEFPAMAQEPKHG